MVMVTILITIEKDRGLISGNKSLSMSVGRLLEQIWSNLNLLQTFHMIPISSHGPVAQLDRATDF